MNPPEHDAREHILELLRRKGAMSIDALMPTLSLSKTATRAHVLKLEEDGMITRTKSLPSGAGRPRALFKLTARGGATFPTRDDAYLTRLIAFLEREEQVPLLEAFFEEVWAERRELLRAKLGVESWEDAPLEARLSCLEELLEEGVFMPRISSKPRGGDLHVSVRACNCPLPAAVRATRIPCRLEAAFVEEVLGGRVTSVTLASDRADACVFDVEVLGAPEPTE